MEYQLWTEKIIRQLFSNYHPEVSNGKTKLQFIQEGHNIKILFYNFNFMSACHIMICTSSERLFNIAGLTVANDRANILPENAQDVIFLRDNWDVFTE